MGPPPDDRIEKVEPRDQSIFQFYRSLFPRMHGNGGIIISLLNSVITIPRDDMRRTYNEEYIRVLVFEL